VQVSVGAQIFSHFTLYPIWNSKDQPAGLPSRVTGTTFFLPWDRPDVPDDVRKGIYADLSGRASEEMKAKGVREEENPGRLQDCPALSSLTQT
jgi:hypothetical protein